MVSPLFDRSMARVPPRRHHAHPCNGNVVTGTGRKPRPSRMRRLPMAFLAALATNGDTGTSPFHGSSWSVEPSDIILYQERGASESSSWSMGVPILVRVTATGHLMGVGGLHIRDFYYPGTLCLRSISVILPRRVRALRLLVRLEIEPVARVACHP